MTAVWRGYTSCVWHSACRDHAMPHAVRNLAAVVVFHVAMVVAHTVVATMAGGGCSYAGAVAVTVTGLPLFACPPLQSRDPAQGDREVSAQGQDLNRDGVAQPGRAAVAGLGALRVPPVRPCFGRMAVGPSCPLAVPHPTPLPPLCPAPLVHNTTQCIPPHTRSLAWGSGVDGNAASLP